MILQVRSAAPQDVSSWAVLRAELWPDGTIADHADDLHALLEDDRFVGMLAVEDQIVTGFAEASVRHDHVNGCDTSPVAFLEGIYVDPARRRRGVARALTRAVADWGKARGCEEFASDADQDHADAHAFHLAAGFTQTERVVFFRQLL